MMRSLVTFAALVLMALAPATEATAAPGDLKVVPGTVTFVDTGGVSLPPGFEASLAGLDNQNRQDKIKQALKAGQLTPPQAVKALGPIDANAQKTVDTWIRELSLPVPSPAQAPASTPGLVIVRGDDGRTYYGELRDAANVTAKTGDTVTLVGYETSGPEQVVVLAIEPRSPQPAAAPSTAAPTAAGPWQRVHGKVDKVEGTTLTFKADDGRTLTVDMKQVNPQVQKALTPGEGATVIAQPGASATQLAARWIQQDSSDPSRGGRVVGRAAPPAGSAGAVDEKAWQRIHGKVEKVAGATLTFKADDGRTLTVDMAQVSPQVQKALTPGEGATVIGHYRGDRNRVAARWIQQDSSAGAASPRTK